MARVTKEEYEAFKTEYLKREDFSLDYAGTSERVMQGVKVTGETYWNCKREGGEVRASKAWEVKNGKVEYLYFIYG